MDRLLYLIEARGPAEHPGLWALGIAESPAGARAWIAWFGRFYLVEGWTELQFYPVLAPKVKDMLDAEDPLAETQIEVPEKY